VVVVDLVNNVVVAIHSIIRGPHPVVTEVLLARPDGLVSSPEVCGDPETSAACHAAAHGENAKANTKTAADGDACDQGTCTQAKKSY